MGAETARRWPSPAMLRSLMTDPTPWFEQVPLDFDRPETRRALAILSEVYPTKGAILQAAPWRDGRRPPEADSAAELLCELMSELQSQGRLEQWLARAQLHLLSLFPSGPTDEQTSVSRDPPVEDPLEDGLRLVTEGKWNVGELEGVLRGLDGLYAVRLLSERDGLPADRSALDYRRQQLGADEQLQVHQIRHGSPGAIEVTGIKDVVATLADVLIRAAKLEYIALPENTVDALEAGDTFSSLELASHTALESRPATEVLAPLIDEVLDLRRRGEHWISADLKHCVGDFFDAVGRAADGHRIQSIERVQSGTVIASSRWDWNRGTDLLGDYAEAYVDGVPIRMRHIPAGTFMMGASADDPDRGALEGPVHPVTLSGGFWLGETPVTQALYQAIMDNQPSYFNGPQHPVERVAFDDVRAFLDALNARLPGARFTLPTEAQWEHGCRAKTAEARYQPLAEAGWFRSNAESQTQPVGLKAPNPWGLYDMLGNVYEWTLDSASRYHPHPRRDPDPRPGSNRIVRGGSWFTPASSCRASRRYEIKPSVRLNDVGFRLCRLGETLPGH